MRYFDGQTGQGNFLGTQRSIVHFLYISNLLSLLEVSSKVYSFIHWVIIVTDFFFFIIGVVFQDGFHYACRTPLAEEIDERKPVLQPQCPGLTHPRHLRYHHSRGSRQKLWQLLQPPTAGSRGIPQRLLKNSLFLKLYFSTCNSV